MRTLLFPVLLAGCMETTLRNLHEQDDPAAPTLTGETRVDLVPETLAFHGMVTEEQVRVLYRGTDKTAYRP